MNESGEEYEPTIGDIAIAPFPFADSDETKLRPVVVVSALPHGAYLVVFVTSTNKIESAYDITLAPNTINNLKVPSRIRVNRMTVVSGDLLVRKLGTLSSAEKVEVSERLTLLAKEFTSL